MAREYTKYTGMNLKWSDDKVKTKEITGCSEINRRMIHVSDFSTPFFSRPVTRLLHGSFELPMVKLQ